jgi:hypothetical protein
MPASNSLRNSRPKIIADDGQGVFSSGASYRLARTRPECGQACRPVKQRLNARIRPARPNENAIPPLVSTARRGWNSMSISRNWRQFEMRKCLNSMRSKFNRSRRRERNGLEGSSSPRSQDVRIEESSAS